MRIFLAGASGLVGGAVSAAAAAAGHEVVGVVRSWDGGVLPGLARQIRLDLADPAACEEAVLQVRPDAIVNAAALSSPSQCDASPELAERMNVALPALLARLAVRMNIRLVHISSDLVFDGRAAPYAPGAAPSPLTLYGRQKAASEQMVHSVAPWHAVTVRAPLLSGNSPSGTRSLNERLLALWAQGGTARLYNDEIRQVCHAANLAAVLLELCEKPSITGIHHWAGTEPLSRLELGRRIAAHFRLSPDVARIESVTLAGSPGAQVHPADLRMDCHTLTSLLRTRPEPFAAQLEHMNMGSAFGGR